MKKLCFSLLLSIPVASSALGQSPERPTDFHWEMSTPRLRSARSDKDRIDFTSNFQSRMDSIRGTPVFGSEPDRLSTTRDSHIALPVMAGWPDYRYVPPFRFDLNQVMTDPVSGTAMICSWDNGGILASGSRYSYPGLMGVESGSVGFYQTIGNLDLIVGGSVEKYAGFRSLMTRYSVNGSITWRINERLSLHGFGSYTPGSRYSVMRGTGGNMGMVGYMTTTNIGAYLSVDLSDRFGVDVGGQGYYNMSTGRWEAQPIVQPYFKLNNGAKLGVDVGGILYHILRSNPGSSWGPQNPTMGPPIQMGPPPVR